MEKLVNFNFNDEVVNKIIVKQKLIDSENQIVFVCDYYFDDTLIYSDSAKLINELIDLGFNEEELNVFNYHI